MRKYILSYFLWFFGLVVLYFVALLLSFQLPDSLRGTVNVKNTTGGYGHSLLRYKEADKLEKTDVLFLGSSHAYRGFDPRVFKKYGVDTFNLGSSSQTPLNTYFLLKRYIEDIDVDLVVIELFWGTLVNSDGNESTIDLSSNMHIESENLQMAFASKTIESFNSVMANFIAQSYYGDSWLDINKQEDVGKNYYVSGGYVETKRAQSKELEFPTTTVGVSDLQYSYLEKIINLANNNEIRLIMVRAPVSNELLDSITNYEDSVNPLLELAQKYETEFIDFNDSEHLEKLNLSLHEHFYDKHHLNNKGVEIFNNYFAPILVDRLTLARE